MTMPETSDNERRYWLEERRGYVPLSEFPPLILALRRAGDPTWDRYHPAEPTVEEDAREIAERRVHQIGRHARATRHGMRRWPKHGDGRISAAREAYVAFLQRLRDEVPDE